jgi:hypothetical protein
VRTRTRTEREGGVSGVRCGAGLPFFFSALREEKGVIEKFVVYFSSSWGLMSLCFCSSSHFSSSTLHIFSVCCFVAIYHTHPHSAKITNAYAYAHACLRTLSAVWIFCPYRRLTNGDALSHTVQDDDLAAVPLATPAGELKFNSMRVTGRGKNIRLSSHSTISLQNWNLAGVTAAASFPSVIRSAFRFSRNLSRISNILSLSHLSHVYAFLILS